ncbi:MAG: ABC transporter ATP-binding protein, partial [Pseudanabaena sp.]
MAKLLESSLRSQVKGLVEVENLSVGFRRKGVFTSVLDNVNFTIQPGEFICLLGPSGCGKSTILNTIAGFIKPSVGNVLVDYQRITKPGADRGFVFQQYSLLPWKTTFQNVEFGLKVRGVPKDERKELVDYYLNRVGLSKYR